MIRNLRLLLAALLACCFSGQAAAITCTSITSPGTTINWSAGTTVTMQTYFEVTCTRPAGDPATSVSYDVAADNGDNKSGTKNQVTHSGGSVLAYDPYKDSACGTEFRSGGTREITDTITWGPAEFGAKSRQTSFWICITDNAQVAAASGAYTDMIELTLDSTAGNLVGSASVTVYAPALCTMTAPPSQIDITYPAFAPPPGVSNTTDFRVNCTIGMPYTMSLDATQGVAAGLRYTLALTQAMANGTGAPQLWYITATFPGGQAGTCSAANCVQVVPHTLTISY